MSSSNLAQHLSEADIKYEPNILNELTMLVQDLNLTTEDLINEWEAYQYNNKNKSIDSTSINPHSFQNFSKYLRYSKSARMPKKTRSRSNHPATAKLHNAQSIAPLMENMSTPNANSLSKTRQRKPMSTSKAHHVQSRVHSDSGDSLINTFLNITTPSKPPAAVSSSTPSTNTRLNSNHNHKHRNHSDMANIMQSPAPIHNKYQSRKDKGASICTLNEHLRLHNNVCYDVRINASQHAHGKTEQFAESKKYRFMSEDIHVKQKAIKQRISYLGERLLAHIRAEYKPETEAGDSKENSMDLDEEAQTQQTAQEVVYCAVDQASQRSCYFLGRIMNDGDNAGSDKITAGNIILEGFDYHNDVSYDKRVKLDISGLRKVSLFPGQIVAVKGINSSGKEIIVEKIYDAAYLTEKKPICELPHSQRVNQQEEVLQVMVACGPFTAKNALDFHGSPMHDFAKTVIANKPNVVILMGPFTDCDNELIKGNEMNVTFDEVFTVLLASFVRFVANYCNKIVVVPSTKDVHHFSAFPQEKYIVPDMSQFGGENKVYFMSNPTEFSINNVSFGVCSADFLFNCCKVGITKNISDRLLSMMSHCINQQNFYPLQPSMRALRMDYNKHRYLYIQDKLDVFIMPSALKQFAKIYKSTNTVCINPSFLTRLNSGGTYAVLKINNSNCSGVDDYSDKVRVDILRI